MTIICIPYIIPYDNNLSNIYYNTMCIFFIKNCCCIRSNDSEKTSFVQHSISIGLIPLRLCSHEDLLLR